MDKIKILEQSFFEKKNREKELIKIKLEKLRKQQQKAYEERLNHKKEMEEKTKLRDEKLKTMKKEKEKVFFY